MGSADLITVFNDTMEKCRTNEALRCAINASVSAQKVIFEDEEVPAAAARFDAPCKAVLSRMRSFEAAEPYARAGKKVCVLNFASFVTPGGGVLNGSKAQEESLCRVSTLYPALTAQTARPFYEVHREMIDAGRSTRKNTDDCIYTPGIKVIRVDAFDGPFLPDDRWYTVDVVTCAAPDQRYTETGYFNPTDDELLTVMKQRIRRILDISAMYGTDVLILGAFGCGAFKNSPDVVARAFEQTIGAYRRCFETLCFAVASQDMLTPNFIAFSKIRGIKTVGVQDEASGKALADGKCTLPAELENISGTAVAETLNAIRYAVYSDENIPFSETARFGGTTGYHEYRAFKAITSYIYPKTRDMRYRYAAGAVITIGLGDYAQWTDAAKFSACFAQSVSGHLNHSWLGTGHFLASYCMENRDDRDYALQMNNGIRQMQRLYRESGSVEALTMLKVYKALEWDEERRRRVKAEMEFC